MVSPGPGRVDDGEKICGARIVGQSSSIVVVMDDWNGWGRLAVVVVLIMVMVRRML